MNRSVDIFLTRWIGLVVVLVALAPLNRVVAAENHLEAVLLRLDARVEAQAAEIRELRAQLDARREFVAAPGFDSDAYDSGKLRRLPLVAELPTDGKERGGHGDFHQLDFFVDYDKGFVIRSFDPDRHPFELKINGWIQFRHHGFARDVDSWTDSAGITRPVRNRNAWDIERARLNFSGYAHDPRLTYFLQLDGDTDGRDTVDFFDYWWAWKFSDALRVQMGKRKVPASRQWLLPARLTRLVDRPMANDFFRPDRTVGVFATGSFHENAGYELMVGNGYRTANLPNAVTDNQFTFAGTHYWDPLGDFGSQLVDYDATCGTLLRFGHSFVYSPISEDQLGVPLEEADFIRLTDGTRLVETGALAPGVTVSNFDVFFYGVDAAWKWQGWSIDAEVFFRWIEQIRGDGPLPINDLMQRGFYVEGGKFVIPRRLDFNARYSQVSGLFGDASEYACGFNWYPLDQPNVKISFDVTVLDGSPLNNPSSDILVGDSGVLFRTQFQAEY